MIPAAPTAPGSDAEAGDRCRAVGARDRTSARAHGDARCRRGELLADLMPSWRGAELLIAERLKLGDQRAFLIASKHVVWGQMIGSAFVAVASHGQNTPPAQPNTGWRGP